jgi:hypothetical protein
MKSTFIFLAMLASVTASAQVTHVELVGANYTNKTVTFRVGWNAGSRDATHLSKVWVWVDYIKINSNNTTSGNTWTRAEVNTVSGGVTTYDGSNRKGFWLQGNASTNYSATLTVQLDIAETKFNWCAYAGDYPPNVTANNGTYTFRGTPPFTLIAANGATTQTVNGKTLAASALTITPTTIKDRTECPGVFCPYQESDLFIDATHICQQRTSGAKNWEAYIKDSRDNNIYRIVQMHDNKWYMAQNLNYRGVTSYCWENDAANCNETNGALYPLTIYNAQLCPQNWSIPTRSEWDEFLTKNNITTWQQLQPVAVGGSDDFGLTMPRSGMYGHGIWAPYEYYSHTCFIALTAGIVFVHGNSQWSQKTICTHGDCSWHDVDWNAARCLHN